LRWFTGNSVGGGGRIDERGRGALLRMLGDHLAALFLAAALFRQA